MNTNDYMIKAKESKKDEFYTPLETIETELNVYLNENPDLFRDKIVLCPCDSERSNFFKYFKFNFKLLGLKKLIATSYNPGSHGAKITITKDAETKTLLSGNGDFRSFEVQDIETDFIITNPPFSLFRSFMDWVFSSKKRFLVLGHVLACSYRNIFPKVVQEEIWLGKTIHSGGSKFEVPDEYTLDTASCRVENSKKFICVKGVRWFTNIDYNGKNKYSLSLKSFEENSKTFNYVKYDNFNAIDVPRTNLIPNDYEGLMGVPLTFLDKFNDEQFKIIPTNIWNQKLKINGENVFKRVIIQKI